MSYVDLIWTGLYVALTVLSVVALVSAAGWVGAFGPTVYGGAMVSGLIRGARSDTRERREPEIPLAAWRQFLPYGVLLTLLFWPAILPALLGRWQIAISVVWMIVIGMHLGRYVDHWFYG